MRVVTLLTRPFAGCGVFYGTEMAYGEREVFQRWKHEALCGILAAAFSVGFGYDACIVFAVFDYCSGKAEEGYGSFEYIHRGGGYGDRCRPVEQYECGNGV